jgi:hypothetical protein
LRKKGKFFFIGNNLTIDFANTVCGADLRETLNSWDDVVAFLGARGYARHEMPKSASPAVLSFVLEVRKALGNAIASFASGTSASPQIITMSNLAWRRHLDL